ncbi:MAG TPA: polysaccharide lyase family 8 super-sandwich domain-containing protein [Candidatus Acidoferrum sp.]|nr:polysaccharide lyase family 8 super-sandwich domain-containing protein [Candidatus Acidoferrum sp.]
MSRVRLPALILVALFATALGRADEFDDMRTKWRETLTFGTNASPSDPLYSSWIAGLSSTATAHWNTMSNSPDRTFLWKSFSSLSNNSSDITGTYLRLRTMALAYSVRGSTLQTNESLREALISGLDWMYANYYNPTGVVYDNWFDFNIATPLALNDTVVLLYSNLTPAQVSNYMSAVDHFTPVPDLTAANKVWKTMVVAIRGMIVKDGSKIDTARLALGDVFPNVTSGDGFYADGSFIFHNSFPYNGGYGVEMLDTIGALMQLLQGSTWQVSDPAQANLFRWIYDVYQPFIYKGALMQMVDGRYHTRAGNDHAEGHDLLAAILRVAKFAPPADAANYKAFVKGAIQSDTSRGFMANQAPPYNVWANSALNDPNIVPMTDMVHHRQFPSMDRVVHRRPNWALGLSMWSSRVANYESTRGENLKGWCTADGMTYLYNADLDHYADNFWSTVDPARLPGTTVDVITRTNGYGEGRLSQSSHTGGASLQGLYGVVAMHANAWNSILSARKSWFMFDQEIVCLGNSVSSSNTPAVTVETIVENRRLGLYGNNAFTVNGAAKPGGPGWAETMTGTSWAHLAGSMPGADIGYYFPTPQTVKALRESRSGSMSDVNTTYGSTNRSTRHYLTMWFDHGENPGGGVYSYVLLPNKSAAEVAAYTAAPEVIVVANNSNVSSVRKPRLGITAANFWRDQSNFTAGVSSDRKASVIFRNDGTLLDIGIADPTQTNTEMINLEFATAASAPVLVDDGISVLQLSPTIKLAVNASNKLGATLRAQFALVPLQTNTFSPVADSYVRNGVDSPVNFGLGSTLQVKTNATAGQMREAFLKFDLASLNGTVLAANLRLVPVTTNDPLNHVVAIVTDNTWTETGIVWTNKPASGPEYARWVVPTELTPVIVPVTGLAQQAANGDGKLSLCISSTGFPTPTNGGFTAYASQQGSAANRPLLTIVSMRVPPTVTLSTSSECMLDAPALVALSADAQDSDGVVAGVDFYCGSTRVTQSFVPPYNVTIPNLGPGTHTFLAVATDNAGLTSTSAPITISVYSPEPSGHGTGLNGDYFSDFKLTTLVLTRTDATVNFTLGSNTSPAPQVPSNFSARWTGKVQARHAGLHYFHTVTDEGVRLWVDGKLLIDNWTFHLQTEDTGSITLVPGRYYDIVMEFYDLNASAAAQLWWTEPGATKEIIPQSQLYPADQGLRVSYYTGTNFNTPVLTRVDEAVNFDWAKGSPEPTVLPGNFSARWTGKVRANQSGTYSFFTLSDDGIRVWINGQLIISNWTVHALTEESNSVALVAGQYYDVVIEYFNVGSIATAILMWQPPGGVKEVISPSNLTPHRNNTPPSLAPIPTLLAAHNSLTTFAVNSTDGDLPAQSPVYSLDPGAPVGAAIDPVTGMFSWNPSNAQSLGAHSITVRVSDGGSPEMTDAQSFNVVILTNVAGAPVTLISTGATWRYQDNGADLGSAWRAIGYSEPGWKTGAAQFGYGVGDEKTITSFGGNPANKFITTYFRRSFHVPDASLVQSLNARMMRDDGAIVYINGTEVWRDNMPAGVVTMSTLASSAITVPSQTEFISRTLSPASLTNGWNVIAVEIHQDSPNTPDARFDFELMAHALSPSNTQLIVTRTATGPTLMWPVAAGLLRPCMTTNLTSPVVWEPVFGTPVLSNGQWSVTIPFSTNANLFLRLQSP